MMRSCEQCRWCLIEDYGYSNYTIEGSYIHCLKNLHPDPGFDRFYGEDERLKFAEVCNGYEVGKAVQLDTEKEDIGGDNDFSNYTDDKEVLKLLVVWYALER